MAKPKSFYTILTEAIADLDANGFDSVERIKFWSDQLRGAAEKTLTPIHLLDQFLREGLAAIYRRMVERGEIAKFHPGIGRFMIEKVRPQLRAELDRRIIASANLIKLNRVDAIEKTLRRFAGWATSIPKGGSNATDKVETKTAIKKSLAQLPFIERRVLIDQGHKLRASLSEILAKDGNAIAVIWHSHYREANYDYRKDHKERDGKVYTLRNNWALERGFMKAGPDGYYDDITSVGEEVYCRCYAQYIYALRDLPENMMTAKGRAELDRVRRMIG